VYTIAKAALANVKRRPTNVVGANWSMLSRETTRVEPKKTPRRITLGMAFEFKDFPSGMRSLDHIANLIIGKGTSGKNK